MNISLIVRTTYLMVLIFALTSCTTTAEISLTEIREIEALGENFQPIEIQKIEAPLRQEPSSSERGFFLIELQSKTNLAAIIRRKEMAFLYYELRSCAEVHNASELYSAPAYINVAVASDEANRFYFYAPIPQNYPEEIDRYQAMRGERKSTIPDRICIGLGAGNMVGESLRTNFVPVELAR